MRSSGSSSDNALSKTLNQGVQQWTSFDLPGRLDNLSAAAAAVTKQKQDSVAARKQLADTTKQFKKSVKSMENASSALKGSQAEATCASAVKAMEGLAKECRQTVKSYQEEIDNLTRRCKASEAAFVNIQSALSEIQSDPLDLLTKAMEQISSQEAQISQLLRTVDEVNKEMNTMEQQQQQQHSAPPKTSSSNREEKEELLQLRREVAEYEVEFRGLKNQDITIRKLEGKIAELEDGAAENMQKELEKASAELAETEGRRAAEALEREAVMERRVQTLELQLKAERAGREATQAHLLDADEGAGEREAAWEAQRRILVDDAERLRESLHETSRERDELRLKVAATAGSTGKTPPTSGAVAMQDMIAERKAYEAEVSELSHTTNSLREELKLKEETLQDDRRSMQATIDKLDQNGRTLASKLQSSEAQLSAAPSQKYVDSIKRELRILKRLEYNAEDAERDDPEMTGVEEEEGEQDFEAVLVSKLKRVESELVRERNQKVDLSEECVSLKDRLSEAEKAKTEAEMVVTRLEKDLDSALNVSSANPSPTKSKAMMSTPKSGGGGEEGVLSNILEPDSATPTAAPASAYSATEKANDDHSVATIIMAQRDRLRARCDALEAERDSFKRELQGQVSASESLKSDNTKLYEKVRYLQTYKASSGRKVESGNRDLDLEALEQRYEASVDPFRQFSRAERQRKLKEMSPMERIVFIVAKSVLGTKEMRTALFFYVITLHLLVFFTTYHGSHGECDASDHHLMLSNLPPDQHMQIAAAVSDAGAAAEAS